MQSSLPTVVIAAIALLTFQCGMSSANKCDYQKCQDLCIYQNSETVSCERFDMNLAVKQCYVYGHCDESTNCCLCRARIPIDGENAYRSLNHPIGNCEP